MVEIHTPLGAMRGSKRNGCLQFLGIRYGQPTGGERRFHPPEPVKPWDGIYDATRFGASAPQPERAADSVLPWGDIRWDEDCLFLNVYTPAADDSARPVLFWIHGGSYINGSGNAYDGTSFATAGDMVVVTINYRLGALGFAELGHLDPVYTGSHNNGVRDMIEALRWTRNNIADFGGDPDRVTICGESAGAGAVNALLCSPDARPLFHQAISESAPARFGPPSTEFADQFCAELGSGAPASLDDLLSLPAEDLISAQTSLLERGYSELGVSLITSQRRGFRPAIDGITLTSNPAEAVAAKPVPLLIGTNLDEGTLFSFFLPEKVANDELAAAISGVGSDPRVIIEAFRTEYPDQTNRELAVRMLADTLFRTSSLAVADAQATTEVPSWVYLFTWQSKGFHGMFGAMHALEIPFVWNQDLRPWEQLMGEGQPWPDDLADRMHQSWISFIKTGDPNHRGIPTWPRYDTNQRPTMEFGDTSQILNDPHGITRASWT